MRIETEGFIQQQPAYTHVGYSAAALQTVAIAPRDYHVHPAQWALGPALITAALMCLIVATVSWRRLRDRGAIRWLVVVGALLAGSALMAGALHVRHIEPPIGDLSSEFVTTLYRLEKLSAETDAFAERTGRYPTEDEWYALFARDEVLDGWGKRFMYGLGFPEWAGDGVALTAGILPDELDQIPYLIASMGTARGGRPAHDIHSWELGADGVYGTDDDSSRLEYIFEKTKTDPKALPHWREPTEG